MFAAGLWRPNSGCESSEVVHGAFQQQGQQQILQVQHVPRW